MFVDLSLFFFALVYGVLLLTSNLSIMVPVLLVVSWVSNESSPVYKVETIMMICCELVSSFPPWKLVPVTVSECASYQVFNWHRSKRVKY
jgi:hypothetical protein